MKKRILFLLPSMVAVISCSEMKKQPQEESSRIDQFIDKADSLFKSLENEQSFMGSFSLMQDGENVYSKVVGFEDHKVKQKSSDETHYRMGSVTKMFTSVLVLKAVEEGKLSLDQTIEEYFPKVKNASEITILQLLHHRSGIFNFTEDDDFLKTHTNEKSRVGMLELISGYDSDFAPGTKGEYSNSNYFLLARILEEVYDKQYQELIKERITDPLKLEDTYNGGPIDLDKHECYSYVYDESWKKLPETDLSIGLGSGSLVSTTDDLNYFLKALFAGKLISAKSLEQMKVIQDTYGLGLMRYEILDRIGFGHRGAIDGYRSTSIYFPKEKLAVSIVSNGAKMDMNEVLLDLLNLYFSDAAIDVSKEDLKKFEGTYVSGIDSSTYSFETDEKQLFLNINNELLEPLVYKGENRFVFEQVYAESMIFTFTDEDQPKLNVMQGDFEETCNKK